MTFPATHLLQTAMGFLPVIATRTPDTFVDVDGVVLEAHGAAALPCRRVDGRWAVDMCRATADQQKIARDLGLRTC